MVCFARFRIDEKEIREKTNSDADNKYLIRAIRKGGGKGIARVLVVLEKYTNTLTMVNTSNSLKMCQKME